MQKSDRILAGLGALMLLIGIGIFLHWRQRPVPVYSPDLRGVAVQNTNRPIVHAHRPAAETSGETDPADAAKLQQEKVQEYLRLHHRNAASLLAAFHSTPLGEMSYLYEAATNFPNDPRVQWTVLARNAFPEERRKWLDSLKESSPSNSLANYLSARDYFKNNQPDAAIKELLAASGKSQFADFSMETILDGEDLGRFSEDSSLEMHVNSLAAMAGDLLPELANFKGVATGIRDLQQQYLNSGDSASAQNLTQAGLLLANRLASGDSGKFVINQLVSMASEAVVLESLDQNTGYAFLNGETPAQRLAEIKQQKASIAQFTKNQNAVMSASEDQQAAYWERMKIFGELPAMLWLQQQTAATPNTGN